MKHKRFIAFVCAFLLAAQLVPAAAFAQGTTYDTVRVPVEELLAAGDYVEGEALAIVRVGASVDAAGQAEELTEVSADSVELAAEGASNSEGIVDDEVARRVQAVSADSYTIQHIVNHERTTEQILRDLYDDSDVVAAEPNYLIENPAALDSGENAGAQASGSTFGAGNVQELTAQAGADNPKDLTSEQWSLDSTMEAYATTPRSPTYDYSMNVPGWVDNRTNPTSVNATTGTVCIMDTGIDTTHPDLQPVLYNFATNLPTARYAALQAEYGCGQYGLNASGEGETNDVTAYDSHGTHVAGIVAAQWNDFGTSGVASGTKIFALRIFGNDGEAQSEAALLKGFRFLVDVAQDVNLKAVNCSWGSGIPQFSYEVMVNELGKKGVNAVYAAGNRSANLDETMDNGGMSNSPYSITVDAAQPDGKPTDFTCYGQASTNVFAPGTQIASTMSQKIVMTVEGKLSSQQVFQRFFPEATDPANLLAYEKFTGGTSGVRFFKENPATSNDPQEITGFIDTNNGYGDKYSAALNVSSLNKGKEEAMIFHGNSGYVYLAIPVSSTADAKWIAVNCAMGDSFKPSGGIMSVTCSSAENGKEGKPVEVETTASKCFHKDAQGNWQDGVGTGWVVAAFYTAYWCQWSPLSFNIDEFIADSNHAHEWLLANPGKPLPGERSQAGGYENYQDPGKVSGVYAWQENGAGQKYIIAKVGIGTHNSEPSSDTKLLIDNVAVGTSNAYVSAYVNMPGSSMAAPAVTGCLAVIAKDEPANATLSESQLEQAALERAAKLQAAVDYDEDLATLCRTGGRVNLNHQTTFTKKAPLITRAVTDGDLLTISGYFFGTSGSLAIDDVPLSGDSIVSWSDNSITASLDKLGLSNNSHVVKVTNDDEAVMRMVFSYSDEANPQVGAGRPLYERTHDVPVNDPKFIADKSDRLYGTMVYCDGSLYALTAEGKKHDSQALWRYDTQNGAWSRCANLPSAISGKKAGSLVSYQGSILVKAPDLDKNREVVWRYDIAGNAWSEVNLPGGKKWPSGLLCVMGDDLIVADAPTSYFKPVESDEGGDPDEGNDEEEDANTSLYAETGAAQEGASDGATDEPNSCCMKVDLGTGEVTEIKGSATALYDHLSANETKVATSADTLYLYSPWQNDGLGESKSEYADTLIRLKYDKESQSMTPESLDAELCAVIGNSMVSDYDKGNGGETNGAHVTIAGLPDGVAIVGSSTLGEDTHIIKNDSTEALTYDRTSSYHRAFEPLAAWGDDGYLYVTGTNATEPDIMYFRSTYYGTVDPDTPDTPSTPDTRDTPSKSSLPKSGDYIPLAIVGLIAAIALVAAFSLRKRRATVSTPNHDLRTR